MNITDEQRTALVSALRAAANRVEGGVDVRAFSTNLHANEQIISVHTAEEPVVPISEPGIE